MRSIFRKFKKILGQITRVDTPFGGITRERDGAEVALSRLREKVLESLLEFYHKDPDALIPADDFARHVGLDAETADQVLQPLREDGEIQAVRHSDVAQNLIRVQNS